MSTDAYRQIIAAPPRDRLDLFLATANRIGAPVGNVEKDFWVCWTLYALYHEHARRGAGHLGHALNNAMLHYCLQLADKGLKALVDDDHLCNGLTRNHTAASRTPTDWDRCSGRSGRMSDPAIWSRFRALHARNREEVERPAFSRNRPWPYLRPRPAPRHRRPAEGL